MLPGVAAQPSTSRQALASEVWRHLLAITRSQRDRFLGIARELGLSPGDVRTLLTLDAEDARPMGVLAHAWQCDASNVTAMIDRLERRGLVERRAYLPDRRVKAVALTAAGARLKRDLLHRLNRPPDQLTALDADVLEAMRSGLARLVR
jgi:DNA-binding MarR family transcriptional regulator